MSSGSIRSGRGHIELSIRDLTRRGLVSAQRRLKRFGQSVAQIGAGLAGAGIAGLGAIFAGPIRSASEFEETLNKFNVVFGENTKAVQDWAKEYGQAVGRSETQTLGFLANAQDTFVPLGFPEDEATEFSKTLTQLAVDLASFNNLDDQATFDSLLSAVVGNTENLRKFGVVAQDAQIKAKALELGFDPSNLSAYEKATAILNLTLEGTTAAQGDATRSSGSFANQMKALRAAASDAAVAIGGPLVSAVTPFVTQLVTAARFIGDFVRENEDLVRTAALVVVGVTAVGGALVVAGGVIAGLGSVFGLAASALGLLFSPAVLVGLAAVAAGALVIKNNFDTIKEAFAPIKETFDQTFGGIRDALASNQLALAGEIGLLGLKAIWQEVTLSLRDIWTDFTITMAEAFLAIGPMVLNGFSRMIEGIVRGIAFVTEKVSDLTGVADPLADFDFDQFQRARDERNENFQQQVNLLEEERNLRKQAARDELQATKDRIDELSKEAAAAREAAEEKAKADEAASKEPPSSSTPPVPPPPATRVASVIAGSAATAGLQSLIPKFDPLTKEQQKSNKILEKIEKNTKDNADAPTLKVR